MKQITTQADIVHQYQENRQRKKIFSHRDLMYALLLFLGSTVGGGVIQAYISDMLALLNIRFSEIRPYIAILCLLFVGVVTLSIVLYYRISKGTEDVLNDIETATRAQNDEISLLRQDFRDMASNLEIKIGTVNYIDSLYIEGMKFEGESYKEITSQISEAKELLYSLTVAGVTDNKYLLREEYLGMDDAVEMRKTRNDYFSAIENVLNNYKGNKDFKFTYTRIFQVPEDIKSLEEVPNCVGGRMREHCERVIQIEEEARNAKNRRNNGGKVTVNLRAIRSQRLTGFTLIDKEVVIVITSSVTPAILKKITSPDQEKVHRSVDSSVVEEKCLRPYHGGVLVFKNYKNVYEAFKDRFDTLDDEDVKEYFKKKNK
ncbi:MAG TPA: hypothetical protein VGD58_01130 [Herpetosiphonaceae bacterium]